MIQGAAHASAATIQHMGVDHGIRVPFEASNSTNGNPPGMGRMTGCS
jgi:hypothetical protein